MRFGLIDAEKAVYPIKLLCRALRVSRGCYAWRMLPESERAREDRRLSLLVRAAHQAGRRTYRARGCCAPPSRCAPGTSGSCG